MTSPLEAALLLHIRACGLPDPTPQYQWHPTRKWRADFAFLTQRILVEVQGGQWLIGRHNRPGGYRADCEKLAEAQIEGWRVLYVTREMIEDGTAIALLSQMVRAQRGY